ncbi:MAG: hypothetical protein D6795_08125 [Deltaproteobacteria bacterium]|nr:MAG: hypothetical protein D6795_08125 [Deltaproteobacteria bacterium]
MNLASCGGGRRRGGKPIRCERIERPVFRWDIDKTYLATDFESVRGLIRILFEEARDKVNVPGSAALLRELQHGPFLWPQHNPIYFISASPPQLRRVLIEKMRLDGIEPAGVSLKDNLRNIRRGRFSQIREQIGYKLIELLEGRTRFRRHAPETLFGDDSESDAHIYTLYAEIAAGRLSGVRLDERLEALGVSEENRREIRRIKRRIIDFDPVERIYIHLTKRTPPERFAKYAPRLVAVRNFFQAALSLYQDGRISFPGVVRVAREMIEDFGFTPLDFVKSFAELLERGVLAPRWLPLLSAPLIRNGVFPEHPGRHLPRFSLAEFFRREVDRKRRNRYREPFVFE